MSKIGNNINFSSSIGLTMAIISGKFVPAATKSKNTLASLHRFKSD